MISPDPATGVQARGRRRRSAPAAFVAGAAVGLLGGMIGLGGAEFRLPLLIGLFGFLALQAVILNKAMSLVVVITALPARLVAVPIAELSPRTGPWWSTCSPEAWSAPGPAPPGPPECGPPPCTRSSLPCSC